MHGFPVSSSFPGPADVLFPSQVDSLFIIIIIVIWFHV